MVTRNEQLLEAALTSRHPDRALWDMAAHLLDTGTSHVKLLAELEAFMLRLRRDGREADEDRVLDVMDCVTGWCNAAWSLASRGN